MTLSAHEESALSSSGLPLEVQVQTHPDREPEWIAFHEAAVQPTTEEGVPAIQLGPHTLYRGVARVIGRPEQKYHLFATGGESPSVMKTPIHPLERSESPSN